MCSCWGIAEEAATSVSHTQGFLLRMHLIATSSPQSLLRYTLPYVPLPIWPSSVYRGCRLGGVVARAEGGGDASMRAPPSALALGSVGFDDAAIAGAASDADGADDDDDGAGIGDAGAG